MTPHVLSGLMAVSWLGLHAADLQLQAGVAKVEITPSVFGPMYGYANRKCGPANGKHDPLFAKALWLATGEARLAFVTPGLGSIGSENPRREASAQRPIPGFLFARSHPPSGPNFL